MAKFAAGALALLLTGACSSASVRDLEAVKSLRSTLAEWAATEKLATTGRAPSEYVGEQRDAARKQIRTALATLHRDSVMDADFAVRAVAGTPGAQALDDIRNRLEPLEKSLERP